jgi:RecJ-like exonuclease
MLGIVSCTKHGISKDRRYFVMRMEGEAGTDFIEVRAEFKAGEFVQYGSAEIKAEDKPGVTVQEAIDRAEGLARQYVKGDAYRTGNDEVDALTGKMWNRLQDAARLLVRKLELSAPIIVRFHNDADGSGGAYSLYLSVKDFASGNSLKPNLVWLMQRGVSYTATDSENDALIANGYSCIDKPLLMLIDFGTNLESNPGLKGARDRFDIIWLDHHPLVKGFAGEALEHYINTWQFGGDSNYTAGLLTSALCKGFSHADTSEFEGASLIGDYSKYATAKGQDMSALLDFITSDLQAIYGPGKSNITPQEIESIIGDKDRSTELLEYANIKLEEAIDRGLKSIKRYSAGSGCIALLDFENARSEDSKYPLPGRFASKLLDRLGESGMKNAVLVVRVGSYLLMRADRELCRRVSLLEVIEEMKSRYPDEISGGGGHRCAGSIKLWNKDAGKEMANRLIGVIKPRLEALE